MKPDKSINTNHNISPDQKLKSGGRFLTWVSVTLAMVFLYLAIRDLDWQEFFVAFKRAHYANLPIIFLWISFNYFFRALRWRGLLMTEKHISLSNAFWANMAGYLGNNILPARAGELIRAAYISKQENVNVSFTLATGLVERFVDLLALFIIGSVLLASVGVVSGPIQTGLKVTAAVGAIGLLVIFLLPRYERLLIRFLSVLPILKENHKLSISGFILEFIRGLQSLHQGKRLAIFILFTSIIWFMDGVISVFLARTLNMTLQLQQALILLASLGLSSAIPSTPGYIGIYQFVAATILVPFGFTKEDAIALVVFGQICGYIVIIFWGGISFWKSKYVFAQT